MTRRGSNVLAAATALLAATEAKAQDLGADPAGSGVIVEAIRWPLTVMTGTIASAVAILAIAGLAIAMLQGRLPARRGGAVLTGCFILFFSPTIAAGLLDAIGSGSAGIAIPDVEAIPAYVAPVPAPIPYDPYAGASVPVRPGDAGGGLLPH